MSGKREELRDRVDARKHELLARYHELKADTRKEAAEARTKLKARIDEIELHLKTGWNEMSDAVAAKVSSWLDREEREGDRK